MRVRRRCMIGEGSAKNGRIKQNWGERNLFEIFNIFKN